MAPYRAGGDPITTVQLSATRRLAIAPRVMVSWFHWAAGRLEHHPGALHILSILAVLAIILLIASSPALSAGILPLLGIYLLVSFPLGSLQEYLGFALEESTVEGGANGTTGHKPTKEDQARYEISKKGRAGYISHSGG